MPVDRAIFCDGDASVEVIAVGGYEEVGKNMTVVKVGEDVVIFDMGIHLDRLHIHEDTDIAKMHSLDIMRQGFETVYQQVLEERALPFAENLRDKSKKKRLFPPQEFLQ